MEKNIGRPMEHSIEMIARIIKEYFETRKGYGTLSKEYGIPVSTIRHHVRKARENVK